MPAPHRRPRTKLGSPRVRGRARQAAPADLPEEQLPEVPRFVEPTTLVEARRQTEILRRKLIEIDLRIKRGELVERSAVQRQRFAEGRVVRDRLRALPARIAADLFACESVAEAQRTLARALDETLEDCADELS